MNKALTFILSSVHEQLKAKKEGMKNHTEVVNFVNICLKNDEMVKLITLNESGIKKEITSFVEVLLQGICQLENGKIYLRKLNHLDEDLPALPEAFHLIMGILPIYQFIETIKTLFQHTDENVAIRAISTLEDKIVSHNTDPNYCHALLPLVNSIISLSNSKKQIAEKVQATFSCCGELARALGESFREDLVTLVPFIIGANGLRNTKPDVVSSAMMTLNYFLRSLGARIIPFLPQFMPQVVNILRREIQSNSQDPLMLSTVFLTIDVVSETLPQFISSYTPDIIKLAVNPNIFKLKGLKSLESASNSLGAMAEYISPRHLLPTIFSSLNDSFNSGKTSLMVLFNFLNKILKNISKTDILEFRSDLTKFFLEAFDFRSKIKEILISTDMLSLENCIISSFFQLVLKLNDEHFKPIYLKMVDWATLSISFDSLSQDDMIKRQITFYHILDEMFTRLKVSFTLFINNRVY